MWLQTIKSKDGELVMHGKITWRNGDEFGFIPQGLQYHEQWWCKLDFWNVIEGSLPLKKIRVND